jgi:hypothetical protein
MPAALWPGWNGSSVLFGAGLILFSWIMAFFDGPGLRRGIPDRYSVAANTANRETVPGSGYVTR